MASDVEVQGPVLIRGPCSGWGDDHHHDTSFVADGQRPIVTSILQVLFHVPSFIKFVLQDEAHRRSCRSLLTCTTCGLYRLFVAMKVREEAQPNLYLSKFINRKETDTMSVVHGMLFQLAAEFLLREKNNESVGALLEACPINREFEGTRHCEGVCHSCGKLSVKAPFYVTRIYETPQADFNILINEALFKECFACPCGRSVTDIQTNSVTLPPYMFISLRRNFEGIIYQSFSLPSNQRYLFMACANGDEIFTVCPDKKFRFFQNGKVQCTSFGKLLRSTRHWKEVLLLYRVESPQVQPPPQNITILVNPKKGKVFMKKDLEFPQSKNNGDKFLGADEDADGLDCGEDTLESESNHEEVGTNVKASQTDPPNMVQAETQAVIETADAAVQVNLLDYERCSNGRKFKFWTGLTKENFEVLYDMIGGEACVKYLKYNYKEDTPKKGKNNEKEEDLRLGYKDRLFLFLLRLRRGLPLEELSWLSGFSLSHTGEVCYALTRTIAESFKVLEPQCFPTVAAQKMYKSPQMYPFNNLRLILDGVEFKIEMPSNFEMQGNTFSPYKSTNTMRFIVGISCSGATIYVSPACEGHLTENDAVLKSGLLEKLEKGDVVMTDRGFDLEHQLQAVGAIQIKPPSRIGGRPLTAEDEVLTKAIAPVRIYSEHAIAEIKDNRLLQGVIPLSLYASLPDLVYIAAYLRNFSPTRIISKTFRNSVDEE